MTTHTVSQDGASPQFLLRHDMPDPDVARVQRHEKKFLSAQAATEEESATSVETDLNQDRPGTSDDSSMRGLVTMTADGTTFLDCVSGVTHSIEEEGDFAALEHAYLAAGSESGTPIFATFDGDIVGEETEGSDEGHSVTVSRFIGVWPEVSCESATSEVSLTNTYWKILSLYGSEITAAEGGKEPHMILLDEESRFTATVGCNQFMGTYDLTDEDAISFGPGAASTRMACLNELQEWETLLSDVISNAAGLQISGEELVLLDTAGVEIAKFEAVSVK
ncbi:META domain-containing protein [Amaricoccus macauensis]|uniref:META domain-containing protein n=1 Tax=Amaricoccus macauensis TaxID=57001 RepID=UPI003C7AB5B8